MKWFNDFDREDQIVLVGCFIAFIAMTLILIFEKAPA